MAVGNKARDSLTLPSPHTRPHSHYHRAPVSQSSSRYRTAKSSSADTDSDPTPVKNPRPRRRHRQKKGSEEASHDVIDGSVIPPHHVPSSMEDGLKQDSDDSRSSTTSTYTRRSHFSRIPKFANRPQGSLRHRLPDGMVCSGESHVRQVSSSTFGRSDEGASAPALEGE